jgi:outer membrane receptor protein involved in Fe transport
VKRLKLAVDYYSIKVTDAIGAQSADVAQQQCFSTAFNPTLSINSPYCAGINRNATGALGNVMLTYLNNGRFQTSGIDFQLDWAKQVGPGTFTLNSVLNYLLSMKSAELAVNPLVEYAGTTGPTQNGLDGGAFRWKLFTTFGYHVGPANLSLQWQHLPSVLTETSATVPTTTVLGAPAYDLFNLSGSVAVTSAVKLTLGVDNLFDTTPPLFGVDTHPYPGGLPGGSYNATYYDTIGRRFYISASLKF